MGEKTTREVEEVGRLGRVCVENRGKQYKNEKNRKKKDKAHEKGGEGVLKTAGVIWMKALGLPSPSV